MAARLGMRGSRLVFHVRVTPRSSRDAVERWERGADGREYLKVRVTAPPEGGKANAQLIALLARTFDLPRSAIEIAAGESARLKTISIPAAAPALRARIEAFGGPG
ncbi:MAG TPA: DUF167 domain-containing protein [Rhizomicrobium sp.]|nr:DUF167 domain-containing protein [Rhizomicrobium sp.]